MLALVEFTGNKDSNYWETNTRENVTVQYLHSYELNSHARLACYTMNKTGVASGSFS